jgi:hypothetical protein
MPKMFTSSLVHSYLRQLQKVRVKKGKTIVLQKKSRMISSKKRDEVSGRQPELD